LRVGCAGPEEDDATAAPEAEGCTYGGRDILVVLMDGSTINSLCSGARCVARGVALLRTWSIYSFS
jgi:hypothetical protein